MTFCVAKLSLVVARKKFANTNLLPAFQLQLNLIERKIASERKNRVEQRFTEI